MTTTAGRPRSPEEVLGEDTAVADREYAGAVTELVEDARALAARGLREGPTASRAIGYREMLAVLDGEVTEAAAIEQTIVATRRFARRQETWFRADPRVHWLPADAPDLVDRALEAVVRGEATPGSEIGRAHV